MNILKQSTAATIKLGPFVDDTDGKTAETALTIGQADIRLSKNGGDIAQTNNATGATHDELGYYDIPLNTTDTGTLGRLRVLVSKAGALPVWQDFLVVTANVFDAFCSTGSLNVTLAATQGAITWGQQKIIADVSSEGALDIRNSNLQGIGLFNSGNVAQFNAGGSIGVLNDGDTAVLGFDTSIATASNLQTVDDNVDSILADTGTDGVVLKAAGLNVDAVTKIQSGLALEATLTAIKGSGWTNQTLVKIVTDIAAISAGSGATPQQIWEYATRVLTAGTNIDLSALATATDLATVDTVVDAIKAKTDNLPASPAAVGSAMTLTAAYDKAKDDVLTPLAVVDSIVDGLKTTLDNIHDTDLPAVKTETAVIKAKTDNLPATPASAGEYTAAIAAIPTAPLLAANYTAPDNASIATIKAKTNLIPANPAVADEYDAALAAIQSDLDNPDQYKADVSGIPAAVWGYATRTLSSFGSLIADIWSHVTRTLSSFGFTVATNSDANVTAIKAKTDNLPANTATALAAIQSDLDNPTQYKADVSGLATTAHVQEVENKIDAIDVTVNTIPTNPLLDTAYTAPDNAGIAAIQEKTEQLTFTAPNKVDASATVDPTGIATSEELDIIGEKVDGVLNKLNVSSVEFVTAVVGSNITILRGDTLAARLLDLGDLTQYASLDFTVKRVAGELDDAAKIRLRKNASGTDDGLLRINGAEYATATDGSIVIDDLTTGDIEIKLNAAATRELVPGNYVYDVQLIIANEVRTLTAGKLEVVADVTRAVA